MINFVSSIPYFRKEFPSRSSESIKNLITVLAIAALVGCALYWLYTYYWSNRQVQPQAPQDQPKDLAPVVKKVLLPDPDAILDEKKEAADIAEDKNVDKNPSPEKGDLPPKAKEEPVVDVLPKKPPVPKVEPLIDVPVIPAAPLPKPVVQQPQVAEKKEKLEEPKSENFDLLDATAAEDIPLDDALTIEENIDKDVAAYLRQERSKYAYGGLFYRYEGVYAALKDHQQRQKSDSVNFCNHAFAEHYEKNKTCVSQWDLYISINPDQRYLALKILFDEIEHTRLCIQGAIHSSEKCQPGKAIVLQLLVSDNDKEDDWLQFLTLLGNHLSKEAVLLDGRPLGQEPLPGIIPCKGIPTYFNYTTDTFTVVDDQIWHDLITGRQHVEQVLDGKVVKINGDPKLMIKASHYHTLGNNRVNPLGIPNAFEKLKLESLK